MTPSELRTACEKIVTHLEQAFMRIQMGRASSGLVEEVHVHVSSRWMDQKMNQVANIGTIDAQTLKIEPWDRSIMADIEKAIYDADIGLTPQNQGDYLLIKVPALTQERRKEVVKIVHSDGEDAKIALRNKRHDARKDAEMAFKNDEISEDERKGHENKIDEIIKEYNEKVESLVKAKSEDVMKL